MPLAPLPSKTNMRHKGPNDVVILVAYLSSLAAKFKVSDELVKATLNSVRSGEGAVVGEDKKQNVVLKELFTQMKKDWKAHEANKEIYKAEQEKGKEEAKAKREADKKAADENKKSFSLALTSSLGSEKLSTVAKSTQAKMDEALKSTLGDKFTIKKDGSLVIAKGAKPTKDDYGQAFAGFGVIAEAGEAFSDSAAKREAQLAMLARKEFGDEWINFFSERKQDVARISKYMKAFDTAERLGVTDMLNKMPIGNFRAVSENKFAVGDKDKDDEGKKDLFAHVREKVGDNLETTTQTEIRKIVAEYKEQLGLKADVKYRYIVIFQQANKQGAMTTRVRKVAEAPAIVVENAIFVFDTRKCQAVVIDKETGKVVSEDIQVIKASEVKVWEDAAKEAEEEAAAKKEEKKPSKKDKDKKKEKEPEPEPEEDEDEDSDDDEEEKDDADADEDTDADDADEDEDAEESDDEDEADSDDEDEDEDSDDDDD